MLLGGVWCPAISKPNTWAKSDMAEFLFNQSTYQHLELNKDVHPKLKIHIPLLLKKPLAAAGVDSLKQAQQETNPDGMLISQYIMYINNSQMAVTNHTPNGVF
jgi:hypothetical protein